MRAVPLSQFMPYGAPELLGVARRHMTQALLTGSALCTLAFVLVGVLMAVAPRPPVVLTTVDLMRGHDVLPPPPPASIQPPARPWVPPSTFSGTIPVPVRDDQAEPDATIPPNDALIPPSTGTTNPPTGSATGPIVDEPDPTPFQYVYVEELPVAIRRVQPEYPPLARAADVSGLVMTRVLVGKDGRVRDVIVDPAHSVMMLNEAAVAAARQWVFQPALANGHPVSVWVSVPFNFKLH